MNSRVIRWLRCTRILVMLGVPSALGWYAWQWLSPPAGDQAARHVYAQLAEASGPVVMARLQQLGSLDEAGIPWLVRATNAEQGVIALPARQVLRRLVADWEQQAVADQDYDRLWSRFERLAASLAESMPNLGSGAQDMAVELSLRMINHGPSPSQSDELTWLADCNRVLRANTQRRGGSGLAGAPTFEAAAQYSGLRPLINPAAAVAGEVTASELAGEVPGGGLGLPTTAELDDLELISERPPRGSLANSPGSAGVANPSSDPTSNPTLTWRIWRNTRTRQDESPWNSAADGQTQADSSTGLPPEPRPLTDDATDRRPLKDQSVSALLDRLRAGPEEQAVAAAEELKSRGITANQIRVFELYRSRDASDRVTLVELLPRLSGIDVRYWLLELSRDADSDVRYAAISRLATSRDPLLREQLYEAAIRDADPRIAGLARQLASGL